MFLALPLLGIVAVAGNVPPSRTAENARKICELAGRAGHRRGGEPLAATQPERIPLLKPTGL